jgi:hypothetical protein
MNMYRKILLLSIFIISLVSCKNNQKEMQFLICKDSIQYWNYEWPHYRSENYGFTFSFNKNGKILKYSFNKDTNERRFFADNHRPGYSNWNVSEDSILTLFDSPCKILKMTEDTIYVFESETRLKAKYIRVKSELNIK